MNDLCKKFLALTLLFCNYHVVAQTVNVTVDLEKQRFLGEESNLDRTKYFNIHNNTEDEAFPTFLKDNNVGNGRSFFGPFANRGFTNPRGNFNTTPATSDGIVRPVTRFIATANPKTHWSPNDDPVAAAKSAVRYWIDEVDTKARPEYWEPWNEPFIKANSFLDTGLTNPQIVLKLIEWYREMARTIHAAPELAKMKVIGFSSAFPSYARRDFSETWQDHMKRFIDIAGADIDAISIHPYDGVNQVGQSNGRTGSNVEATLDLIEAYTNQKFGSPKKIAITEFGTIIRDFTPGPAPGYYNEAVNALTIRSFNGMLFGFFERQDNIEITIPFVTGRANFHYVDFNADGNNGTITPYIPAYLRPTEILDVADPVTGLRRNNTFILTFKQNFYKFWKDVKGDRAKILSDDLDVQVQAFVDGNTAFIALNNLDDEDKTVDLSFLSGATNITNVNTRSLVINALNTPVYNPGTDSNTFPTSTTLLNGETKIFKVTYSSPIQFTSSVTRKKYYATSTQQSTDKAPTVIITANTEKAFTINNVTKGTDGDATLRISVGIPLRENINVGSPPTNLDRLPSEVTFNGTPLTIPTNWKGYDQADRADFYGMFELDVPYNLINDGNNTVNITYAKTGGRIACVVLSTENEAGPCTPSTLYADEDGDGLGDPAVTIQSCGPLNGFVDNSDDKCIDDIENICLAIRVPAVVEAEEFIETNGTLINGNVIESINNGDSSTYDINVAVPGSYDVVIKASTPVGGGGTVKIFSGTNELETITITDTGGITTFQDFTGTFRLDKRRLNRLRIEYSGAGGIALFNIDSFEFISNEAYVFVTNPESDEIAVTINNTETSFSLDVNYATLKTTQSVDLNLRGTGAVTGGFASIRPGAITKATGTFTITLSGPLPVGLYTMPIFINSTGDTPQFFGGPSPEMKLQVIEPTIDAVDDVSQNNPRGATITLDILANDAKLDGLTPTPAQVTVDINANTSGQQTQLIVANEGTWSYDTASGILSFVPLPGFIDNPTDITYTLTEIANNLSDTAMVNFEYIQPPTLSNDSSVDNNPGVVSIPILSNDRASNGSILTSAQVTVDLDPSTAAIENTLSSGVLGDWSYNTASGALTFTPNAQFSANPPAITYQVTETATGLSSTSSATVTVTYREFVLAEFTVRNVGEICASENNGRIEVSAETNGSYAYQLNGAASVNFTKETAVENLDAGTYNLVITDTNTQDTFSFDVTISEPENLKVSTKVLQSAKQVTLDLSGSEKFKINLNGTEFTTTENTLALPLKDGINRLEVQGEKECQGKFDQKILIGKSINVYPNPVLDNLMITTNTADTTSIKIFDISGKLMLSQSSASTNGTYQVNVQDLSSGMYFVNVSTTNLSSTFKITK